jgi:glycosyltransferase involved in cell wall biosynthesis
VQLHLFGKDSDRIAPNHPSIQRHGYVADLAEVWGACDFMICPVISGGGVSVKVAEALYNGMPLVGSRLSARGLPLDPDPSIVLLDGAEDWIQFLNSGAQGLAGRTVPRSIADRFSVAAHSLAFSTFLLESR